VGEGIVVGEDPGTDATGEEVGVAVDGGRKKGQQEGGNEGKGEDALDGSGNRNSPVAALVRVRETRSKGLQLVGAELRRLLVNENDVSRRTGRSGR
jgi:hypothetical protein